MSSRKKAAPKSGPETRAFIASLGLVEWGAALAAANRLLAALDAPAATPEALERLQKLIRYRGEQHTTLVIRTILESEGNELALIEPVVRAVSDVMKQNPEWPEKGVAWIEAFDGIPLLQIVETMRGLELFREESLGTYLAVSPRKPACQDLHRTAGAGGCPATQDPNVPGPHSRDHGQGSARPGVGGPQGPHPQQPEVRRAGAGPLLRMCIRRWAWRDGVI